MNTASSEAASVSIPVPQSYKEMLVHNRGWRWLFTFALLTVVLCVWYFEWRRGRHFIDMLPHMIGLLLAFPLWLNQARKTWYYVINDRSLSLIHWQFGGRTWHWHYVDWRHDVVLSVEEDEWRTLPALRVRVKLSHQRREQNLWMVYAHEDAERVRCEILPLIEKYRRQYRHDLWADLLRSE